MDIKAALARVVQQLDLTTAEMQFVMRDIMTGQCSPAQIGALLVALRMKSESLDEIEGAALVMRELAERVVVDDLPYLVDIVGTGGDGANLFNISTAASFVAAAAGAHVAKHGNRAVSSKSGSADLLETAGVRLDISAAMVERCVREVGVGFMFAVNHHGAMKHAIGPRRELGLRTIFNILGPLTNPAGVKRQIVGVFNEALCRPLAEVLKRLGSEHAMVVHARDGLDEISLATTTHVAELKGGEITEYAIQPEDFGIRSQSLIGLSVAHTEASFELIKAAFSRAKGDNEAVAKAADIIALNAGAALYVAGVTTDLKCGVQLAEDEIHGGRAGEKMEELAVFTQGLML
ncbi:MAG TPA: anthranilate phosphoribosyltransferase [Spongiibacteraceae bacterium]|nr:anthranilate phosphoribosyltransferase [Spongiibacteraceae bacterium]